MTVYSGTKPENIRLDEDVLKTNIFVWPHVFKKSSRRFQNVFKMLCKTIFKTSSGGLADISSRRFQDVSSSEIVLVNTSSRVIDHVSEIYCKDGYV